MCILIVNFHETLNESSINIQRTMEKAIPFIREKENFCPHRRENLEKLFDCCESIIPPGHYPIFHSFMYPSIVLAIFLNEETVILLLSSTGIRILFQDNKKNFIGLRGFLHILSFVLGPFNRKDTRFFYFVKTLKRQRSASRLWWKFEKPAFTEMAENHDTTSFRLNWFCKYIFYNVEKQHV